MGIDSEAGINAGLKMPFEEAIEFFREKVDLPTARWDDLWRDQHAKGFMSAGAARDGLLRDLRSAVDKAIAKGTTLAEFRRDFDLAARQYGWSYKGKRNWRSEIIFDTNARQAYQAGRWKQQMDPEVLAYLPYRRYLHGDSSHPREFHLAWNGLTLPADDPWWDAHYPQNGFG